jgi:hypothetical protein
MYKWYKERINVDQQSKIIIGLGDSFTQGQGACDVDVWEKYKWDITEMNRTNSEDVLDSNYNNSWVHQLCKDHLPDYTPINFGFNGRGNRAAIKELYLHPELNLELARKKIVIFPISGHERFDFVDKEYDGEHKHFITMWPDIGTKIKERKLWQSYAEFVWSERSSIIELLLNIAELKTWCDLHNAKLILTSAFSIGVNRESFIQKIRGDDNQDCLYGHLNHIEKLVDIINWDEFLYPVGYECISDFLLYVENRPDLINGKTTWPFHQYGYESEKFSENGYITKCAHPSKKGHKEIARMLYKHILDKKYI